MLYQLTELEEIIETAFFSAWVEKGVPVSLIIVGPSGSAKSALIKQYHSPHLYQTDSFTSQGLWELMQADTENKIKFLTVPDINPTLTRKPAVVLSTIGNLLTLTYDGSVKINDGRREKVCKHDTVGLLSAVTPEIYRNQARRWLWIGLRRRIIPLFFSYTRQTIGMLQELVASKKIHAALDGRKRLDLPKAVFSVAIAEKEAALISNESEAFARKLGKLEAKGQFRKGYQWIDTDILPISPHLTLRTLAQAKARMAGRATVTNDDITFLRKFLDYTDPATPKLI